MSPDGHDGDPGGQWLSYRDRSWLNRPLRPAEAREVSQTARRLVALLLLGPTLDANFAAVVETTYDFDSATLAP